MEIVENFFESDLSFIPGFRKFFRKVRSDYKTCVATSMPKKLLDIVDRKLCLSDLFPGRIFSVSEVTSKGKPNPDLFLFAARRLDSKPQDCIVIEDAPLGISAAKRAGMKCIALTTTYSPDKLLQADLIVNSYANIDLTSFDKID